MHTRSLGVFVKEAIARGRLASGDMRRLLLDVLPCGATSREEIDTLLSRDSEGAGRRGLVSYFTSTSTGRI